jgi:hypothetical protein
MGIQGLLPKLRSITKQVILKSPDLVLTAHRFSSQMLIWQTAYTFLFAWFRRIKAYQSSVIVIAVDKSFDLSVFLLEQSEHA